MSFPLVYNLLLLQFVLGYAPFEYKSPGLLGWKWIKLKVIHIKIMGDSR